MSDSLGREKQSEKLNTLQGKTVVITRSRRQADDMIQLVESKGATAFPFPVIETKWVKDLQPLDQALAQLNKYDWLIMTSVNTVHYVMERINQLGLRESHIKLLRQKKIIAVGPKTANEMDKYGLKIKRIPDTYQQEGIIEILHKELELREKKEVHILYPRATIVRRNLGEQLRCLGYQLDEVPVYETVPIQQVDRDHLLHKMSHSEVDVITFTSSSTVKNFVTVMDQTNWREYLNQIMIACIGPITSQTAKEYGLQVDVEATEYTIEALINEIEIHIQNTM